MIKSVDSMKYNKDTLANQMSSAQIHQYVTLLKTSFPALTHIAISVPLNPDSDYPQGFKANAFEAAWINEIHSQGLGVILRGVFCEAEGIYNFPINQSGAAYYLAKAGVYFDRIKPLVNSSDIIAIFPESTNNAFSGQHFLGAVTPDTYVSFFTQLKALSTSKLPNNAFLPTNNFTELASGWCGGIPPLLGKVVVDHYGAAGQKTVAQMQTDLTSLKNKYNLPIFIQEWADTDNLGLNASMADMFKNFPVDVNFWVGWNAGNEGILSGSPGSFTLNAKGQALQAFFAGTPTPTSSSTVLNPPTSSTTVLPPQTSSTTVLPPSSDLTTILNALNAQKTALDSHLLLDQVKAIVYGSGTGAAKITKLKTIV